MTSCFPKALRPLKNTPFRPISASGSNFNPQNTHCIPAVEIFAFLELRRNWAFFKGLTLFPVLGSCFHFWFFSKKVEKEGSRIRHE
jgi:hypothetical protein